MSDTSLLEVNKGDEFITAIDISASMQATDTKDGSTRLNYTIETFKTFANEAAKFDENGVSLYAFGATVYAYPDLKPEDFSAKLAEVAGKREGATQTHMVIKAAYAEHKQKASKQTFLLIFTDGEPTDAAATQQVIVNIANEVADPAEFRIAFITVGNRSPELDAYLTKLDDGLTAAGAKHDIVDVKKIDEVDFIGAVNGALTD